MGGLVGKLRNCLDAVALVVACGASLAAAQPAAWVTDPVARQSIEQGYWIVRPGDGLRAIARRFFPGDRARANALRDELIRLNPQAFLRGDPNAVIVGARIALPPELGAAAAPSRAAEPSRDPAPPPIPPRAAPAAPSASYLDRLIDESVADDPARREADDAELPGRRSVLVELRSEWRDNGARRVLENGLGLAYRRETAAWGEIGIEADLRHARSSERNATERSSGGKFTLYQYRLPLVSDWLADNTAGVLRSMPPNIVASGFRVNLPAPLLFGAASHVYNDNTRVYAQAGRVARLLGFSTQEVELDEPRAALIGGERQVLPGLRVGAQANVFRLEDVQPWRSSVALAAETQWLPSRARLKVAAIADDEQRKGFWFEADAYQGFFHHRAGGYQFDRDLAYTAVPTVNDERLLYARTDYRTQRLSYSLALDAAQTNLDRDPRRAGHDGAALFASATLRLSRTLTAGGSVNVRHEEPRTAQALRKDLDSETAFLRVTSALGTASFDLSRGSARGAGIATEGATALAWNHEWPVVSGVAVTTTLSRGRESGAAGDLWRNVAGLTVRATPFDNVYFDANLVHARVDRAASREANTNASLGASWQFLPDWQLQLTALWNTIEITAEQLANPAFRDKSVLLALRYQRSYGLPIVPLGAPQRGAAGSARIFGRVFFDENGDGIRQPNDRPAARITLFLDGRVPVVTDAEGRFEFPLVSAGLRALQVGVETVPLPWGLADERSIPVTVPSRGDVLVEIPLQRIAP